MNSFWSITLATLAKDIRLEWRSKDALNAMLFFSLLVVVIFMFSFDPLAEESRHIVGGLVWVAFLFAVLVALMTPLFVIFYNLRVLGPAWQLIPVALLGTWALVVNGTFFAAMSLRTRSRELMLPLLLFPISIPAVVCMVAATTNILTGENSAHFYLVFLLTYD